MRGAGWRGVSGIISGCVSGENDWSGRMKLMLLWRKCFGVFTPTVRKNKNKKEKTKTRKKRNRKREERENEKIKTKKERTLRFSRVFREVRKPVHLATQ
ncbi:hypothetical protein ACP81B_14990 [Escherichia coli]